MKKTGRWRGGHNRAKTGLKAIESGASAAVWTFCGCRDAAALAANQPLR